MSEKIQDLASFIEHTLLRAEATASDIDALCDEALEHGFHGVCLNPVHVRRAADRISAAGGAARVVTVAGFPLGANSASTKADEARRAMDDGADEVDMVVNLGALMTGDLALVRSEIEGVACAVHRGKVGGVVKVILETAALSDDAKVWGCRCAAEGEADFVKTSTGFHTAGGASVDDVMLLRRHASPMGVKAAGGIRSAAFAVAMIDAGATRLGTSSGVGILQEFRANVG